MHLILPCNLTDALAQIDFLKHLMFKLAREVCRRFSFISASFE